MAKISQREKVLKHLETYGSITAVEAFREYGIMQLAARICELRDRGVKIVKENIYTRDRYGDPLHWVKYILEA